jgi:hypothetical protein
MTKTDPYDNKTHRRIDLALVVFTLLLIAFMLRLSAHSRTSIDQTRRTDILLAVASHAPETSAGH